NPYQKCSDEKVIFLFQAEDGIRAFHVTGVQTCALPISEDLPIPEGPPIVTSSGAPLWLTRSNAAMTSLACGCAEKSESARWIAGERSCWPGIKSTISPSAVSVAWQRLRSAISPSTV